MCSVPLNCTIVCHLWRILDEALPATMTELCSKIAFNVVLHSMWKTDTYKSVPSLASIEALHCKKFGGNIPPHLVCSSCPSQHTKLGVNTPPKYTVGQTHQNLWAIHTYCGVM